MMIQEILYLLITFISCMIYTKKIIKLIRIKFVNIQKIMEILIDDINQEDNFENDNENKIDDKKSEKNVLEFVVGKNIFFKK